MVKEVYGDLLKQPVDIIAHQTNCAGVMGAGIALQIKKSLLTSEEYNKYVNICKQQGADLLGKTQLLEAPDGRIIANCFGENIPTGKGKDTDIHASDLIKTGTDAGLKADYCRNTLEKITEQTKSLEPYFDHPDFRKGISIPFHKRVSEVSKAAPKKN